MLGILQLVPLALNVVYQLPVLGDEHGLVERLEAGVDGEEQRLDLTPLLVPSCGRKRMVMCGRFSGEKYCFGGVEFF